MSEPTGETTVLRRPAFVPEGRTVAAERGWGWFGDGWTMFRKAPGLWIGMIVVFAVIFILLGLIPIVGAVATMVLQPVLGAGLMIVCAKLDHGEAPLFGDLFAGFQNQFGKLATLGALYLAGTAVIVGGTLLVSGVGIVSMMHGGGGAAAGATMLIAVLVMMALMVPLMMGFWFAVPIALFHDRGAVDAIKASFAGCLRNIVPFLVYGVVGLLLGFVASIPLMLGWLVLGPVLAASIYAGYKDIYLA